MRKMISLLLALTLLTAAAAPAFAENGQERPQRLSCEEQDFSVLIPADADWEFSEENGVTVYTGPRGSIPYVLVYRAEDWIVDAEDYLEEQYTPYMKKKYGRDLLSWEEREHYSIGGRELAVGLYTYRLQGRLIDMLRAYDVQDRRTVVYTAKYIRGRGDKTLDALALAVKSFRPGAGSRSETDENPRWDYSVSTVPGGDLCYSFSDFMLTIPEQWRGRYNVTADEHGIRFYQSLSRSLWEENGGYTGGFLFGVAYAENEDFRNLPSFDELGRVGSGWYYLVYPTDVQAYMDSKIAMEEYQMMFALRDSILEKSCTF